MMPPAPERTLTPPDLLGGGGAQYSSSKPSLDDGILHGIAAKMSGVSPIRHSVSMLEMNEINDVNNLSQIFDTSDTDRSLGEECHGGLLGKKLSSAVAQEEEDDDFLFFDTEDDDDVDNNVFNLVAKAATPSSADTGPPTGSTKKSSSERKLTTSSGSSSSSSGGMRRVQSMSVMAQSSKKINLGVLTSMAPDIHTIHEGSDDEGDNYITNKEGGEQMVQVNFGDDDNAKQQPSPESSMRRHPSSNSIRRRQQGGALRNSLNASNHGGSNFRHSLHSSTHSGGGLDLSSSERSQPKKSCMKKSTSTASLKSSTSSVSFGELEIRSYNVTVGTTPTPNGVPLSLDWEYDPEATQTIDVDTYENNRGARRSKGEMFVPNQYRVYLLMKDAGLSRRDIKLAIEESQRAFKNRQKTVNNLKMQPMEEALEKTRRSFSKLKRRLSPNPN
eukprot:scaffold387_cov136-Skeletonema_menzelii.AAC.13